MKKTAIREFLRSKFFLALLALTAAVLLGAGAVFAWFLTGNPSLDDFDNSVVGSSNVTMDLIVDGVQGSFVFEDALPGKEYSCTVRFYNKSSQMSYVNMDFRLISSMLSLEGGGFDTEKSFLNVIGVRGIKHLNGVAIADENGKFIPEDGFTCLAKRLADDPTYSEVYGTDPEGNPLPIIPKPENANVRIFSNVPVPAGGPSESWKLEVTFTIKFLTEILDASGNPTEGADMNDFQGQSFKIGQLRLEDVDKELIA